MHVVSNRQSTHENVSNATTLLVIPRFEEPFCTVLDVCHLEVLNVHVRPEQCVRQDITKY